MQWVSHFVFRAGVRGHRRTMQRGENQHGAGRRTRMPVADVLDRLGPYAGRLLENEYAQENLREAIVNLRAAYGRASRRKATAAAADKKLHREVGAALRSLREALLGVSDARKQPKKRRGRRRLVALFGLGACGALAIKGGLHRRALASLRGAPPTAETSLGEPAQQPPAPTSTA